MTLTRPDGPREPSHQETPAARPDADPTPDEGIDESLELTHPASDPPRPVRIHPDSDTAAGRPPVRDRDR